MFSNLQTQTRNCRCTNNCFRFWILSSLKYWIADDGLPIWVSKLLHIPMHLMWQFNPSVTEDWKEKERCESNLNSPGRRFVSKMLCQLFQEVFKPPLSLSLSSEVFRVPFSQDFSVRWLQIGVHLNQLSKTWSNISAISDLEKEQNEAYCVFVAWKRSNWGATSSICPINVGSWSGAANVGQLLCCRQVWSSLSLPD